MPEELTQLSHIEGQVGDIPVDTLGGAADSTQHHHFVRHIEFRPMDSIPCLGAGRLHIEEVQLPQYYKESFFSKSELYHPELPPSHRGVAGDPISYTIANDDILSSALVVCFLILLSAFAFGRNFIQRHVKDLFYIRKSDNDNMGETKGELHLQMMLVLHTILLMSIVFFLYSREYISTTYVLPTEYHMIGVYSAIIISYIAMKSILMSWVNLTFFDVRSNSLWVRNKVFLYGCEGILFFPVVMVQSYLNLSINDMAIYYISIIIFVKILAFYKCFSIFFRRIGYFLQIFLYFCTLELIPMALLWVILNLTGNLLKVNY